MAKTQKIDEAAAKARKQKIILAVVGGLFLLMAVIQVPKLMKGSGTADEVAPVATAPVADGATGTATPGPTAIAGVTVPTTTAPDPLEGKLVSFSLFPVQDPFVPQVDDKATAGATDGSSGADDGTTTTPASGAGATPTASNPVETPTKPVKAPEPVLTNATLEINGTAEYLVTKGTFPAADPMFKLMAVKKKLVKIGVAGGAFSDGKLLVLKMGASTTLVNTATGARYQIKLVYTGATAEQVETFTAGGTATDAGKTGATTATTPSS